ncbi:cell division protein Fic, partial [Methanocalculus chunghsingensis]
MGKYSDNRAGVFVRQKGGYEAFIPHPLPPGDLVFDEGLLYLLSKADGALARLDGVTQVLPNPDLFVAMYIKKEALLSSQIEGTQASLQGVLEFEAHMRPKDDINEIQEVLNYIKALHHGIEKLEFSPLTLNLINEIHRFLIHDLTGR